MATFNVFDFMRSELDEVPKLLSAYEKKFANGEVVSDPFSEAERIHRICFSIVNAGHRLMPLDSSDDHSERKRIGDALGAVLASLSAMDCELHGFASMLEKTLKYSKQFDNVFNEVHTSPTVSMATQQLQNYTWFHGRMLVEKFIQVLTRLRTTFFEDPETARLFCGREWQQKNAVASPVRRSLTS